eukprot:TRINITY_DN9415_c0_g3_i3.p1 TRINITY_DN9415_c0_g3~~TRINITY_DN9415_c0_g3_i3.p1  ORF type:complete len:253 (-),score=12.57 TRINITY_DN9415_c0_g3_i3:56-814(-)
MCIRDRYRSDFPSANVSHLNKSKSKQAYSFSKAERFPSFKLNQWLHSNQVDHSTTFLYSAILALLPSAMAREILLEVAVLHCKQVARAPAPDAYNASMSFLKINPAKSFSIGLPYDERRLAEKNSSVPGPSTYVVSYKAREPSRTITMKERYKYFGRFGNANVDFVYAKEKSPGPCAYDVPSTMKPNGAFTASCYKNSLALKFTPEEQKDNGSTLQSRNSRGNVPNSRPYIIQNEQHHFGQGRVLPVHTACS